jgi:hypothetical protein
MDSKRIRELESNFWLGILKPWNFEIHTLQKLFLASSHFIRNESVNHIDSTAREAVKIRLRNQVLRLLNC